MKIVTKILLKMVIFTAVKNRCILHGHVFVMHAQLCKDCIMLINDIIYPAYNYITDIDDENLIIPFIPTICSVDLSMNFEAWTLILTFVEIKLYLTIRASLRENRSSGF